MRSEEVEGNVDLWGSEEKGQKMDWRIEGGSGRTQGKRT